MLRVLTLIVSLALLAAAPSAGAQPLRTDYESKPFWLDGQTVPHIMLLMERDWKIFYPAYNNLTDLDDDGVIDIGFNPNVTYVGYFDSDSCYSYSGGQTADGLFTRIGPTSPQTAADLESLIPQVIKDQSKVSAKSRAKPADDFSKNSRDLGIRAPVSRHGVCNRNAATVDGAGQWHGNWLNFAATSRIDAIRKVLYGGKRYIDTPGSGADPGRTVLELTPFLPYNSHNWGGELPADNIWFEYAKTSPWYDIPSFTGYIRPKSDTMHFWARCSYYSPKFSDTFSQSKIRRVRSDFPLFEVAANVPITNWHPYYKTPIRIWDWVGDHANGSLPDDNNLVDGPNPIKAREFAANGYPNKPAYQVARRFTARVEACQAGNIGPNEGCRLYDNRYYKPAGLLQQYGETNRMFFGLLTGTMNQQTRFDGGVVRHHIQPFANYVDALTGVVARPGLIDTIDRLTITGIGPHRFDGGSEEQVLTNTSAVNYNDGTQAGNPLGEMVYEAMRYFARSNDYLNSANSGTYLAPIGAYAPSKETPVPVYNSNTIKDELPRLTKPSQWSYSGRPSLTSFGNAAFKCPKPVILVLSEVFPDRDYNQTMPKENELAKVPLHSDFKDTVVPQTLNIDQYLDIITDQEKLKTSAEGKHFFFPEPPRGICKPGVLTGGLKSIKGHCPSEPSLDGGYGIAAIAYYAHTHDLFNLKGSSDQKKDQEKSIDLYAVGIPGNFPDITFTVDETRSLTLMPITVARDKADPYFRDYELNGYLDLDKSLLRTLINFFIESWEMDSNNRMFRAKFATNFEFNTNPGYMYGSGSNNMERDVFNRFDIILLTTENTPLDYRENRPIYINSGPFRTRDHYDSSERRYYAFRNPNPNLVSEPLDVTKHEIVGVAIQNYTHGSFVNIVGNGGYTISGVKNPGAYIDAGYCGGTRSSDYTSCAIKIGTATPPDGGNKTPNIIVGDVKYPIVFDPYGDYLDYKGSGNPHMRDGLPPNHGANIIFRDALLTPWECPYAGYTRSNPEPWVAEAYGHLPDETQVCGKEASPNKLIRYYQVRSFLFDEEATGITKLPNPLWLAAKYGGFKDRNANGLPDLDLEWQRGSNTTNKDPYNYFNVANISQLPEQLGKAFETISDSVGTGTANSASISSVLGGGLSIQTQYRPEYTDADGRQINWVGSAFALFVDKWGNLRADTKKDDKLQMKTSGQPLSGDNYDSVGDLIVHTVSTGQGLPSVYLCHDPQGNNNYNMYLPTDVIPPTTRMTWEEWQALTEEEREEKLNGYPPTANCQMVPSLDEAPSVWNAAERLAKKNPDDRKIYTYYGGTPSDGSQAWASGVSLDSFSTSQVADLHKFMGQGTEATTSKLIEYVRGKDFPNESGKYRSRTAKLPWPGSLDPEVWRMADIINSKPVIVGEPSGRYHLLYGDASFAEYAAGADPGVALRRQVAYVGSNDGLLHAINLGFFGSFSEGIAGYDRGGSGQPELGEELWAYVPTAILPHLQWLADPSYGHGYFVDLQPHVADVKGPDGRWRTIMIVGLRLGGNTIEMVNQNNARSYSEYFALDVTNPEIPPKLMWRFSAPNLGLTTAKPTVVRNDDKWYAVLPSGPTYDTIDESGRPAYNVAYDGYSNQKARVFVIDAFSGLKVKELEVEEENSFFNDTFLTRPYADKVKKTDPDTVTWSHHVVYMGLSVNAEKPRESTDKYNQGAVYRLQMANADGTYRKPEDWTLARMYNAQKPVTGAVNSAYDSLGNLWVVFGTGRIWSTDDLVPCGTVTPTCCDNNTQYFYGLKEPLDPAGLYLTFEEIKEGQDDPEIVDVSGINVYADGTLDFPSTVEPFANYDDLYISMTAKDGQNKPLYRGYKRKLQSWDIMRRVDERDRKEAFLEPAAGIFELINTQPKIDGLTNGRSNTTFTVYQTTTDVCNPSGQSYLLVVETFTGLPAPYMAGYYGFEAGDDTLLSDGAPQVTGIRAAGPGIASEAVIIKTASGDSIYSTKSPTGADNQVRVPGVGSGFISWREVLDLNFDLTDKDMYDDITNEQTP